MRQNVAFVKPRVNSWLVTCILFYPVPDSMGLELQAKFCDIHDTDNCAQSTSQNQLVKASLDQQADV